MKITEIFSRRKNGKEEVRKLNPDAPHNIYHPDFANLIEPAFKVGDKQYYRFGKELGMPWGRYIVMQTFLHEQSLGLDTELLTGYCALIKKAISGTLKTGIDLTKIYQVITSIEARINLGFEVETTYRLASCIYFDETEDLYGYDKAYNDSVKIPSWKEAKTVDFFYTRPMSELLGLNDLSPEDLQRFIQSRVDLLKDLHVEPITET